MYFETTMIDEVTKKKNPVKRIEFLAKKFQVFDQEEVEEIYSNGQIDSDGLKVNTVYDIDETGENILYALYTWDQRKLRTMGKEHVGSVRVYEDVFVNIVQADPTDHKEYVQWMLTTFVRLIKDSDFSGAIRFVTEDLFIASEYLEIFHAEKHKPKFKALCANNQAFKDISDPSNINQYRDLSHLFDAVDPYIKKDVSKLGKDIYMYAKMGLGKIPYEDRKVLVFIPKNAKASKLFFKFARWCTTSQGTFDSYTKRRQTSKGTDSELYIIIPKTYLLADDNPAKTDEIYQFHFESEQFMNKSDRRVNDLGSLISDNVGLSNYFYDLLIDFARHAHRDYHNNVYIKTLKSFGFTDLVFEVLPPEIEEIVVLKEKLGKMKKLGGFKNAFSLILRNCEIEEIPESLGDLQNLGNLSIPNNGLTKLPNSIGKLKNLVVINISGNYIKRIPETIKELDLSNGGSLNFLSYSTGTLSDELLEQLKEWLPNTTINEFKGMISR